ncbi:MAG: ATP-dependent DNA helicase RecG [Candidatus Aminicenantes bacterium]|nr:ATP-dependent DNA helicase RecG [Candidatus Aminicenantes bacterium]
MTIRRDTPVEELRGIGPGYGAVLRHRGIASAGDLLLHFPDSYLDLSRVEPDLIPGQDRLYAFRVRRVRLRRNFSRRSSLLSAEGEAAGQALRLVFFNQPYLQKNLISVAPVHVYGRVEEHGGRWQMVNPLLVPEGTAGGILPRYRPLGTLKGGRLRSIIAAALAGWVDDEDPLPEAVRNRHAFPAVGETLRAIHQPGSLELERIECLKERFIYDELLCFQLELQFVRDAFRNRRRTRRYHFGDPVRGAIDKRLPFRLSAEQEAAFSDIVNDLKAGCTMQRLLQGEVGSGKTIVAFLALLLASENGFQGAFLAPTAILARQHYDNARAFFGDERLALLTGATPPETRRQVLAGLARGDLSLVFGTHALIGEQVAFRDLALVVIDEQHRFGVAQRAALYFKSRAADLLVTTATPIPRTMLLTLYSDLAVSTLKRPLPGRQPVATRVITAGDREKFYRRLKSELEQGRKGYVILPLIEPSEQYPEMRSLREEEALNRARYPGIAQASLSGRSTPGHKERALRRFVAGDVRLLLATTVVEVGIDVPDATFMVIENADRYGLAQLHQLRGRIGRGSVRSTCFLLESPRPTENGRRRLRAVAAHGDGFRIAEMDLQLRGGGLVAGLEQAGEIDFRLADPRKDLRLLQEAQVDARRLLEHPELQNPRVRGFLRGLKAKIRKLSFS